MIKIVVKNVGEDAKVVEIEKKDFTLEYMQGVVGGYIQCIPFPLDINSDECTGIDMFLNDEGKLEQLDCNLLLVDSETTMFDVAVGNVFFCSHDEESESIGLTDEQIEIALQYCVKYRYV